MRKIRPKKYYSKEIFSAELAKILEKRGISQDEFNKEIGVQQAVTRWKTGDTTPSADSLLAIKNVFDISIDQLLTGEEPQPALAEFVSEHYEARSLEALETTLLFEVLEKVEEVVIKHRQKLSVRQTARLAALAYEHCRREREKPNELLIEKYLLLAD
jgi:transcriptional regulator with XRE-family HTH domain